MVLKDLECFLFDNIFYLHILATFDKNVSCFIWVPKSSRRGSKPWYPEQVNEYIENVYVVKLQNTEKNIL